jgi:hypothetical protein
MLLKNTVEHPGDNDLTEESLLGLMKAVRAAPLSMMPTQLVISEEGIERMKLLCADDPEFRKRVLAEFPQFEGIL